MQANTLNFDYLIQSDLSFINRDKCWDEDYHRMYGGKLVPPLGAYKELVLKILPVMLTNGTRDDMNRFEVGMWEDVADGAYFRSAIATSSNISMDARLESIEPFKGNIFFFEDLRIYFSNQRFYFKNIENRDSADVSISQIEDVTIPQIEIVESRANLKKLIKEIRLRTRSKNIQSAFSWINNKITTKPITEPQLPVEPFPDKKDPYKYDVFISHKSADFKIAENLYNFLVSKGKKAFLSEKKFTKSW